MGWSRSNEEFKRARRVQIIDRNHGGENIKPSLPEHMSLPMHRLIHYTNPKDILLAMLAGNCPHAGPTRLHVLLASHAASAPPPIPARIGLMPSLRALPSPLDCHVAQSCPQYRNKYRLNAVITAAASTVFAAAGSDRSPPSSILLRFLDSNFIPLALITAITLGWTFPGPGAAAASMNLHKLSTIGQFTISGVLLQRGEAQAALRAPLALAYGLTSILLLTPMLSFAALRLPLQPPEMALGLAVFCCVPTTLSTCVTLTNACKGNSAVALLLVVCSSVLGVFSIPLVVGFVLGAGTGLTNFQPALLFKSLVMTVLLPLLVGIALQSTVPGLAAWRTKNRKLLSYASTFFLCLMPWMQLSVASASRLPLTAMALASAAAAGAALHVAFLAMNSGLMSFLRFSNDEAQETAIRKAVLLSTSEKTLPVAVAVLNSLTSVAGAAVGLAVIPCVLAHLMQIAIDSWIVSGWNKNELRVAAAAG
jgi:solute carrier family 10 (sodium/bile acid cotransporter), member 7